MSRGVAYLCGLVAVMLVAFVVGTAHFEATQCSSGDGECDLAGVEGVLWAVSALALYLLTSIAYWVYRSAQRRRSP